MLQYLLFKNDINKAKLYLKCKVLLFIFSYKKDNSCSSSLKVLVMLKEHTFNFSS